MTEKRDKTNNEKTGMLAGLFLPALIIIIYYLFENPENFVFFLKQIFMDSSYTRIFGLCIVPNFVLFFIFRYQKKFKASEGVSIATLIYLLIIVMIKYIN